jgi:DNA-binding MarR family transcriptional regulator
MADKNYITHRAIQLAAFHCTHPDLDATDKALLAYLALHGDHGNAANAHPGNINIADALGLTDRPTDQRIKNNIERGLIERTHRADGRKRASVYRLCLESPYFPVRAPNGECLTDKPRCLDDAVISETALSEDRNRAVKPAKPRCETTETALSGQPTTKYIPEEHHTHTASKKSACVNSFSELAKWLHTDMLTSQWKHGEKEAVERLITTHGGEVFLAVELLYWREQDPEQFAKTLYRWTGLINSFEGLVHKVKPEFLEELAYARWKEENPQEYQRRLDASVARQTAELVRIRDSGTRENEASPEDFFREESLHTLPPH